MTDEKLEDTMWETTRPWEEQWESLKVNESRVENKRKTMKIDKHGLGDTDRTGSQSMKRNTLDVIYVLEFKRVTDTCEKYVSETQKLLEIQDLVITQVLKRLFKDTQWTISFSSCCLFH